MKLGCIFLIGLFTAVKCNKILKISQNEQHEVFEAFEKVFLTLKNSSVRLIGSKEIYSLIDKSLDSSEFPLELLTKSNLNSSRVKLKTSYKNVILAKNCSDFFTIFTKQNIQHFRLDGYYILLSLDSCNFNVSKKLFEIVWRHQISNINIICSQNKEVLMKTFMPYQSNRCNSTDPIIISRFINNSWSNKNFFVPKFRNLYHCHLRVASFLYPPIIMRETLNNGTYRYYGSEMEILMLMAYALNFSINHTYYNYFFKGLFFENGTATGILKEVMNMELDMAMGFYFLNYARAKWLSFSQSHYYVSTVIVIPPGKPFTPFEKLFKPFQVIVWICLISTICVGILVILVINCKSAKVQKFVYGNSINSPLLNIFNILLNGIQHKLPNRTFARYLLTVYMIFCFIFRTLYQGSLFQFLQSDARNPEMQTIDDMMAAKFKFYVRDTLEHSVKHMSFYNRTTVVKPEAYATLIPQTLNPLHKEAVIVPIMEVIYSNQINKNNFTLKILKEYLLDISICYFFPKNFHLMEVFNEKMGVYKAAGLVSLWMDRYLDKKYVNLENPKSGPRVLTLKDLEGGFELFAIGIATSCGVFLMELISFHKRMKFLRIFMKRL